MGWQVSRYNHLVRRPDGTVGYNARTGTFVRVEDNWMDALNGNGSIEQLPDVLRSQLAELGFITSEDEIDLIATNISKARIDRSFYNHFVIAPTLDCNFRCGYCDQNSTRAAAPMTPSTLDCIGRLFESAAAKTDRPLHITWYGGEPLLAKLMIERLNCSLRDANLMDRVSQSIVTNGILLDETSVEFLLEHGIRDAQVSIDALYYRKPISRGVLDPDGKPSVIVRHVEAAIKAGMNISIRVNIDMETQPAIAEIEAALERHGLRRYSYVSRVESNIEARNHHALSTGKVCGSLKGQSRSIPRRQFSELDKERLFDRANASALVRMLVPKTDICGATKTSMLVFSPDGGVSRCWNSVGVQAEQIGNAQDPDILNAIDRDIEASVWANYLPTKYESCRTCHALPLCSGGCSHARLFLEDKEPPCTPIKYYLNDLVTHVAERLEI